MKYLLICVFLNPVFALNYSEDISPIIYNNCTTCHRSGEIASFLPLTNYGEVFNNRNWIAYAIVGDESRHGDPIMPPGLLKENIVHSLERGILPKLKFIIY